MKQPLPLTAGSVAHRAQQAFKLSNQAFENISKFTMACYRVTTGLLVGTIKVALEVLKLAEKHNRRVSVRLIDEFLFNDL